jgi:hypothetical protein
MIIFINDSVLFVDGCSSKIHRDVGSVRDIQEYKGTIFTKKEVEFMIADLPGLLKTWKRMEERHYKRCVILTEPISLCMHSEDSVPGLNYLSPRYITFEVIDEFIHMVPVLVRWL